LDRVWNSIFFDETLDKYKSWRYVSNMRYWIKRSKEKGLNVCGHLIYGLPNENQEMMLETFRQTS
jgi:radical SAM superfamily enzyme